jgi:hypothetical protein
MLKRNLINCLQSWRVNVNCLLKIEPWVRRLTQTPCYFGNNYELSLSAIPMLNNVICPIRKGRGVRFKARGISSDERNLRCSISQVKGTYAQEDEVKAVLQLHCLQKVSLLCKVSARLGCSCRLTLPKVETTELVLNSNQRRPLGSVRDCVQGTSLQLQVHPMTSAFLHQPTRATTSQHNFLISLWMRHKSEIWP